MTWETYSLEDQRLQVVLAYIEGRASMTEICRRYNISRKTAYKWLDRFKNGLSLSDQSKAPLNPYSRYGKEEIDLAIACKLLHRRWGPKKVLASLAKDRPEIDWPSASRLYEIFKDHQLVRPRKLRSRVPATAPLGDLTGSNDTWAVDLKGWFLLGNGQKCEPLTITDCFSRYLIRCVHLPNHSADYVWPVFDEAFREYGLPNRVRSDNGPPFGSTGVARLTKLSVNLIKAGVIPEWIRPGHPEENGRHERFHLTLKDETANPPEENLVLQLRSMARFHEEYNFSRPHEALGMQTPGNCYQGSRRQWDGILRSPEYDTKAFEVRKVGQNGGIWVRQTEHYIGTTLTGEYVGLKLNEAGELEAYYGPIYLGKLDLKKGLIRPKIKERRQR